MDNALNAVEYHNGPCNLLHQSSKRHLLSSQFPLLDLLIEIDYLLHDGCNYNGRGVKNSDFISLVDPKLNYNVIRIEAILQTKECGIHF
jgi:hypothetical protein